VLARLASMEAKLAAHEARAEQSMRAEEQARGTLAKVRLDHGIPTT
jgi:hypothetical protein